MLRSHLIIIILIFILTSPSSAFRESIVYPTINMTEAQKLYNAAFCHCNETICD